MSRFLFHLPSFLLLLSVALSPVVGPGQSSPEGSAGPKPSGKYAVGRTLLVCIDQSRIDPVAEKAGTKREFMVIAWYPAHPSPGAPYAPWMPAPWVSSETDFLYYHGRHSDAPLTRDQAEHAIRDPLSHSIADASLAEAGGKLAVILLLPARESIRRPTAPLPKVWRVMGMLSSVSSQRAGCPPNSLMATPPLFPISAQTILPGQTQSGSTQCGSPIL